MKNIIAILLLSTTFAFAEDAPSTPPNTVQGSGGPGAEPIAGPEVFYLEVTPQDLNVLAQAINELPKKIADPLLLKLNGQINKQAAIISAKEAASKPKKGK